MEAIRVVGRNGFSYEARQVSGDVYHVGKYLVLVKEGIVVETICRATRQAIAEFRRRGEIFG